MLYLHYNDAAEIDHQLTHGQTGPERDDSYDNFAEGAYRARERYRNRLDLRYGKGDRMRIDLFYADDAGPDTPTVIFFHGGGWRLSDKFFANFYAEAYCANGVNFAACAYGFSPLFTIPQIVEQAKDAIQWLHDNAGDLGLCPNNLFLSGNSAGAHLAACALLEDWQARGFAPESIRGGVLFSGLYDLVLVYNSTRFASLALTEEDARACSPLFAVEGSLPPLLTLYGGDETDEFKRQTLALTEAWSNAGNEAESVEIPNTGHFSSQWVARTQGTEAYARMIAFVQRHSRQPAPA
jgi:arylformamidase